MKIKHLLPFLGLLACYASQVQAETGTLKRVADTGILTIGYRVDAPPFSMEQNGQPVGYAVDLCRRIATAVKERLKLDTLETKFVPVDLNNRFKAVASGDVDMLCAATTITLSRLEQVDFSLMTFLTGGALLSRSDAPVNSTGDLSDKTVVVISETNAAAALKSYLYTNLIDAQVIEVESLEEAQKLLDESKVDAVAHDQIVMIGQIAGATDRTNYAMSQDLFSYEPYALVLRRNDADFRLVINRALAKIYRSGQYKQLFGRWFAQSGVRPSPILVAMYAIQALPE